MPARIWRDFMVQASGKRAAPPRPKRIDPAGPVEPLDIPDIGDIPVGERTRIGIEGGDAVISTEVGGSRIDLRLPIEDRAPEPAAPRSEERRGGEAVSITGRTWGAP